jgi:hypothetical protein
MPETGAALRQQVPWVPFDERIYLIMDNASGHGTEAAIERYTRNFLDWYNMEIIHQVPQLPETNVLDLGSGGASSHGQNNNITIRQHWQMLLQYQSMRHVNLSLCKQTIMSLGRYLKSSRLLSTMKVETTVSRKEENDVIIMLQKRKAETRTFFLTEVLERDQNNWSRFSR